METEVSNTPEAAGVEVNPPSPTPPDPSPSTDASLAGSAPSPVNGDSVPPEGGEEGAPSGDAAGVVEESKLSWNGELDALEKADWFTEKVPEEYRNVLLEGMRTKYRNVESGLTKATQRASESVKAAETKVSELTTELEKYKRWMDTGEDLSTQSLQEADKLRQQLEEAGKEREAAEATLREQLQQEFASKLSPVEQERDQLKQQLEEMQRISAEQEEARNQEVRDGLIRWVDNTAPELWDDENEDALSLFTSLLETGVATDPKDALVLVGAKFQKFNPSAPEELPPDLAAANTDSSVAFEPTGAPPQKKSYAELKREIEEELRAARG